MILKNKPKAKEYDVNDELVVSSYEFDQFSEKIPSNKVKDYRFIHLDKIIEEKNFTDLQRAIRIERKHASDSQFAIEPIVQEFRGIRKQQEKDYQDRIDKAVSEEIEKIKEVAMNAAREEGEKRAYEEAKIYALQQAKEEVEALKVIIQEVESNKKEILENQKQQLYELIKLLTKWVILREISDDAQYIKRLLEKLILDLDARENLLVKVNKQAFKEMPQFLEIVQNGVGELKNIRLEVDQDATRSGIIIESISGIIDGSFDVQMKQLDELFSSVTTYE